MMNETFKMVTGDKKVYKVTHLENSYNDTKVLKITCPNGSKYEAEWVKGELSMVIKRSNRNAYLYSPMENNMADLKRFPMWILEKFNIFYNVAVI